MGWCSSVSLAFNIERERAIKKKKKKKKNEEGSPAFCRSYPTTKNLAQARLQYTVFAQEAQEYTKIRKTTIKATDTLKHQPTVWPVPYACAQPYHPGSGSHGQLFRSCQASSAWHIRRAEDRATSFIVRLITQYENIFSNISEGTAFLLQGFTEDDSSFKRAFQI